MENNDNSFWGWETRNGQYINFIKHEIEKEISPAVKHRIKEKVSSVVNTWGEYMNSGCRQIAQLFHVGYDCSQEMFSLNERMEETVTYQELTGHPAPSVTPLELLYLRIVQYEYLIYFWTKTRKYLIIHFIEWREHQGSVRVKSMYTPH